MTVEWTKFAQGLTDKPVKAMLTGPITILQWSFVRDDEARPVVADQIALAIRDEVADLEKAGIGIIQIDEPGLREGLPLRRQHWQAYLDWACVLSVSLLPVSATIRKFIRTCVMPNSTISCRISRV